MFFAKITNLIQPGKDAYISSDPTSQPGQIFQALFGLSLL